MRNKVKSILILDTQTPIHESIDLIDLIVLWRGFTTDLSTDFISISKLIEQNAEILRAQYLALVYDLGQTCLNGQSLIENLKIRPDLSYWWMTLIAEKCNFAKSPHITDIIRIFAFVDWANGRSLECVTLASDNVELSECLSAWCENSGIDFHWLRLPVQTTMLSHARHVFISLPLVMQAWLWLLKYLWERWPLRGVGFLHWQKSSGRISFVSYFDNCFHDAAQQGIYSNRYWAHLPDVLGEQAVPSNWLHLYVKDDTFPTPMQAALALNNFNRSSKGLQSHVFLDSFLSSNVILKTFRDWFCLFFCAQRLQVVLNTKLANSTYLWPFLRADWDASMFGSVSMSNLLFLNLFEAAFNALPQQAQGLYLEENFAWEFGFIHAWRSNGHGRLIGIPHSTVRFWDLRYFSDPRNYQYTGSNALPLPDLVACNGPLMRSMLKQGRYPDCDLVDVEALRYLDYGQRQIAFTRIPTSPNEYIRLLVLGDYLSESSLFQMSLLQKAVSLLSYKLLITVKPHPNCPIQSSAYPLLHMHIRSDSISNLLSECDLAYTGPISSAVVDAYCSAVPVISVLDPDNLNLSPLRGCTGVLFASTPEDLANAIHSALVGFLPSDARHPIFTIDSALHKWRALLL